MVLSRKCNAIQIKISESKLLNSKKSEPDQNQNQAHGAAKSFKTPVDSATALANSRLQEKIKKQARTHSLLVSIVLLFAFSWFPLNCLNIILDVFSFMGIPALVCSKIFRRKFIFFVNRFMREHFDPGGYILVGGGGCGGEGGNVGDSRVLVVI